jgi:hypothetical protein
MWQREIDGLNNAKSFALSAAREKQSLRFATGERLDHFMLRVLGDAGIVESVAILPRLYDIGWPRHFDMTGAVVIRNDSHIIKVLAQHDIDNGVARLVVGRDRGFAFFPGHTQHVALTPGSTPGWSGRMSLRTVNLRVRIPFKRN